MKQLLSRPLMLVVTLFVSTTALRAQEFRLLYGMRGDWKFELGDDMRWAEASYDDKKWETIYAPAKWEDEGFPGYDGYAWYRKSFRAEADWKSKSLYLRLGLIDDVDDVYINGKKIGSTGRFPPAYETAYHVEREYFIPAAYLKIPGDNLVAVRVYDDQLGGGIYEGRLGVYEDVNVLTPDIPLAGEWRFRIGDDLSWKNEKLNDNNWSSISVPGFWEHQGQVDYDGYAWYRIRFHVPSDMLNKRMILMLGNIDDYDETFLNGTLIGRTGTMGENVQNSDAWVQLRAYTIPSGGLRPGENVLAVRVYDGYRDGGIYRGPVGIVSRSAFLKWKNLSRESWFDWIFR